MDFTPTCPGPRERVCDSGQRAAAGSKSSSVTDRAQPLLRPCTRLTQKGPLSEALGQLEWLVGGAQGRRCEAPPAPNLLLTCDRPDLDLRFTIKFQEYSPNLWGHEFRSHHDYYIIGTAGQRAGSSGNVPLGLRADKGRDPWSHLGWCWGQEWRWNRGSSECQLLPLVLF